MRLTASETGLDRWQTETSPWRAPLSPSPPRSWSRPSPHRCSGTVRLDAYTALDDPILARRHLRPTAREVHPPCDHARPSLVKTWSSNSRLRIRPFPSLRRHRHDLHPPEAATPRVILSSSRVQSRSLARGRVIVRRHELQLGWRTPTAVKNSLEAGPLRGLLSRLLPRLFNLCAVLSAGHRSWRRSREG